MTKSGFYRTTGDDHVSGWIEWKWKMRVTQSCLILCNPMDYTIHGILQTGILEWVAFPIFRRSSKPRDRTQVCCIAGGFFNSWAAREAYFTTAAAAAAKSLQSCPTLCDPGDGSPPSSPVPGILQARTLEWVAISFSNAWKWKVKVKSLSRVWLSDPMDCSLPGSSIHGIFQARVLEWGAIAFSGSFY